MDEHHSDILIIGAGMAGLSCAVALVEAGLDVRVLDKGRGPGGRMAARRAQIAGQAVTFDHGAQYFTAREPAFQRAVAKWEEQGAIAPWPAAGEGAWVGTPGMNGPIKAMSQLCDVRWATRAISIERSSENWQIETGDERFTAAQVLIAVPAEQAAELLENVSPELAKVPAAVRSEPCWAVMASFAGTLEIEADGVSASDQKIAWAARNSAKPGRAGNEAWVLHASPARSREIIDTPKEEAARILLADFFEQTGASPSEPVHLTAHRWLYAMPAAVSGDPARYDADQGLGITGDYLHSPRVEGAFISGQALAGALLQSRG